MANKKTEKTTKAVSVEKVAETVEKKPAEKTYSETELQNAVNAAVAQALAKMKEAQQPIIAVSKEEYVTLLFVGAIARGTTVALGKLGQITRSGGTLDVPKKDFLANLGSPVIDALLRKRQLIVIDGLSESEMDRFGLSYEERELLSQNVFFKLFDFSKKEICEIFEKLCPEHKKIVAKMYLTKYFDEHDNRVTSDVVKSLNKISKSVYAEGLFTPILESMAEQFTKDED